MGMHLLQKMGWTPGQGLGKEGTGTLQPLLLEVKLDTRGLQAKEEVSTRSRNRGMKAPRGGRMRGGSGPVSTGGKHPVSLLGEYCSKHKLGPPEYDLCFECGPDHKKNFLFKITNHEANALRQTTQSCFGEMSGEAINMNGSSGLYCTANYRCRTSNQIYRVRVAGVEYQPAVASANKKQAKADAAQLALQKLGILT